MKKRYPIDQNTNAKNINLDIPSSSVILTFSFGFCELGNHKVPAQDDNPIGT